MKNKIVYTILAIIIFILLFLLLDKRREAIETHNILEASNVSIKKWKNSYNETNAKVQVLETEKLKTFTELQFKDSLIQRLQKAVKDSKKVLKKEGSSITIVETITKIDTIMITSRNKDTITSSFKDKWIDLRVNHINNQSKFDLKIYNDYEVILGKERKNIFHKYKPFVKIKNRNPYTDTKDMVAYRNFKKERKFGVGPSLGINYDGKFVLGLTVTYILWEF